MSGSNIVADTSLLVNFFNGHNKTRQFLSNRNIWLSGITEIELLCFPSLTNSEKNLIKSFLRECVVIDLEREIKDIAIKLRGETKIKLPDAIIAATSIYLDFPLFTMDKGFSKIPNLQSVIFDI